jgi:hypothetical protein
MKFSCERCRRSRRTPGLCGVCRSSLKQAAEREFGTSIAKFLWQAIFGVRT